MDEAPTLTDSQVLQYLRRIDFPISEPPSFPPPTLDTLRRLIAGHLYAIPFENLSLHYASKGSITLDRQTVFDKFVTQRKGGYCMEQNLCFAMLLQSLKYDFYTIGARVYQGKERGYGGFNHMAIILTLDNLEYLVDVGFGGFGLTAPLPIFDGQKIIETRIEGVLPEEHRVTLGELKGARKGHKSWLFQSRRNQRGDWETAYAFEKDVAFFPADYEVYYPLA
jgi:arylamine N-acetyltransferase